MRYIWKDCGERYASNIRQLAAMDYNRQQYYANFIRFLGVGPRDKWIKRAKNRGLRVDLCFPRLVTMRVTDGNELARHIPISSELPELQSPICFSPFLRPQLKFLIISQGYSADFYVLKDKVLQAIQKSCAGLERLDIGIRPGGDYVRVRPESLVEPITSLRTLKNVAIIDKTNLYLTGPVVEALFLKKSCQRLDLSEIDETSAQAITTQNSSGLFPGLKELSITFIDT